VCSREAEGDRGSSPRCHHDAEGTHERSLVMKRKDCIESRPKRSKALLGAAGLACAVCLVVACGTRWNSQEEALAKSGSQQSATAESQEPRSCTHPFAAQPAFGFVDDIVGSVDASDPTQAGRLQTAMGENVVQATCSAPKPVPAVQQAAL